MGVHAISTFDNLTICGDFGDALDVRRSDFRGRMSSLIDDARRGAREFEYGTTSLLGTAGARSRVAHTLDLLRRGIEAGKVPEDSIVCHDSWTEWRPLAEAMNAIAPAAQRA